MKRVKIMLLSLALFAVVGGALAFKAKFSENWCATTPYGTGSNLYCSFNPGTGFTTTQCNGQQPGLTTLAPEFFSCTTIPDPETGECPDLCPAIKSVKFDH